MPINGDAEPAKELPPTPVSVPQQPAIRFVTEVETLISRIDNGRAHFTVAAQWDAEDGDKLSSLLSHQLLLEEHGILSILSFSRPL